MTPSQQLTQNHQAQRANALGHEEWEEIFDSLDLIITIQDPEMRILKANRAALDFFNTPLDQVLGQPCYTLFRKTDTPCPDCPALNDLNQGQSSESIISHNSSHKIFRVSMQPILNPDGQLKLFIHQAKEISTKIAQNEQLLQIQKMNALSILSGGIAHEFNNILSIIMGFTQLTQANLPTGSQTAEDLSEVLTASQGAANLVNHLLSFSGNTMSSSRQPFAPQAVAGEVAELIRSSLPKEVEFKVSIDPTCGQLMGDRDHYHQILYNLCLNSLQAMEAQKNGQLELTLLRRTRNTDLKADSLISPQAFIETTVLDTGCGMTSQVLERICEPFFTTRNVGEGTGMGLAVVHGLVQSLGGTFSVESAPNQGTRATFVLPDITGQENEMALWHRLRGNEAILIIHDKTDVSKTVGTLLSSFGYKTTSFTNSSKAWTHLQTYSDRYDLIVCDQLRWEPDDLEPGRKIMQIQPDLPFIILTDPSDETTQQSKTLPANVKIMTRPLDNTNLLWAVRRGIDRVQTQNKTKSRQNLQTLKKKVVF